MVASTSNHFFLFDSQPNSETVQDPLIFPLPFQSSSKSIFISKDSILFGEYTDSLYLFSISNKSGFILNSFPSSLFFNEATRIAKDHLNQLHISGLSQSNFFNTSTAKWQRDTVAFNKMIPTPNATFFATKKHGLLKRTSVSTFFKSFGTATPDSEITDLTLNGSILWLCITGKPSLFAFNISDETITEIKIPSLPNHVYPTSIITDDEGRKWLALSHNFGGAVYYDGGTISNTTDDYWLTLNTTSGKDKLGAIWIATNNGACVFYTPKTDANKERILNATMVSDLAGKVLTAVASDPSGDIWFGSTTGVWVVNSSLTLKNYYSENSTPLLSNRINQIYFDPQQGQMIFATNKGVSSLFIDTYKPSTSASFLSSFPSPFRIPSDAPVIIHGLMENANINILTASGKHVRTIEKATSGGASWDGKDDNGQWVSSGIYLIVAYESNSKTTSIGKLAVIRGN
ncbi:hypothetical protein CHS0354_023795 [Potamilus streckersoni]|uniref:FlgD/Vpr Ig-like domain-containing protein n=1 Tax=Potamilus streckersoni TaxID=2493646 RepID=A0AAE0VLR2_9BIVA|nr:hypothetical protein CHS0354_023795 [Potamilus streckersoni]